MRDEMTVDYNDYKFSKKEWGMNSVVGLAYFFIMGMIFYSNVVLSIIACIGIIFYMKEQKKLAIKKRKALLREQFREAMYVLSSALSAGRSVEQAFMQTLKDLGIMYDDQTDIIKELTLIVHKLNINETIESALSDFAERSDIEDIDNFTSVFIMAKRSGGDLIRIIKETTNMISEKMEIQKEIDILVVQKQYEQKVLSFVIPGMIVFFQMTSPEFLGPLYTTLKGRVVMTVALTLYVVSSKIGKKIVDIEI